MEELYNQEIEIVENEVINDDFSNDDLFNISSWGADLSFRELISMYEENELQKPELQRKYVWDKVEASRFIDSILLGLPVPSIFLAQSGSTKLIVDGYQRIMTVYDYVNGIFSSDNKIFRLSNSNGINSRWRNKAFKELSVDEQRRIRSSTIHAIVFEQKEPKNDDTSMYQIFERINTSGRSLNSQEIRNCIYQGSFNRMLFELNKHPSWRNLFGINVEDSRMRDIELILRFLYMTNTDFKTMQSSRISIKKELTNFMGKYQNASDAIILEFKESFIKTMDAIQNYIGRDAFHNYIGDRFTNKFHPTIFDAISINFHCAIKNNLQIQNISKQKHIKIFTPEFEDAISIHTTDIDQILKRIEIAHSLI